MDKIKHLHARAGFGLSPSEWLQRKDWPLSKAVDQLFAEAKRPEMLPVPTPAATESQDRLSREEIQKLKEEERKKVSQTGAAWIRRMANESNSALLERMCFFWHDHFACESKQAKLAVKQLNVFRKYGLGNFRNLLLAVARDPSMIRYLNNQQNRKQHPNENFARELMELFTIGRGNYTEGDVKEAAKAFTGWASDRQGNFQFRSFHHDYGPKHFMGRSGRFDGEDIIDILLEQKQTARFITAKIYRYFVGEKVQADIIEGLASDFYQSGYDISRLMRSVFESDWFYDPAIYSPKIKSPVDLLAGMMRNLQINDIDDRLILRVQRALGQTLFRPPNVAGWPGGKSWIDNATLMVRLNMGAFLLREAGQETGRGRGIQFDVSPLHTIAEKANGRSQIQNLSDYLLSGTVRPELGAVEKFASFGRQGNRLVRSVFALLSLPEYQLC
ncbi:MAG: DUF1800 domain-containing protein [Saprospiraceae bacterium]|nr:DUF1800 domain-containing protein [Saprospiraceae bacterium]